jgi:hypothetical protein
MTYGINNKPLLIQILWIDAILGGSTAILGITLLHPLTGLLGLTRDFILSVSIITLCYAITALMLANQKNISISLLRTLIFANWFWTLVSIVLLFLHFKQAELLGKIFLILQIIAVGALAYLEGKQLVRI